MSLNINEIRNDFPILQQKIYNKPLIYLDNGATTQKPEVVIDAMSNLYRENNSNIHRGVHRLSERMTTLYEDSRSAIREFINAKDNCEIIFTKGTTDSINLVAFSFGEKYINEGDEILISYLEHHSNIVPWQMLCERRKAILKVIPISEKGELLMDEFDKLLTERTKLVSIAHISNVLGTILPVKEIIEKAHKKNAKVLIDGAQAIQHLKVDVQELDCDFYAFSGHKIYASTGIGVLYGKEAILNELPPYQGGGDMIKSVSFEKTTYNDLPLKFEAGTPDYIGAVSLARAIDYVTTIGIENIAEHEHELLVYATEKLSAIEGITIYGNAEHKASVISFLIKGIHPYDAGQILDKMGIAVRTGHHCAQPLMDFYQISGTVRASFAFYNTKEEIDALCKGIQQVITMFA
jgi:cysteine desulfurase / selenocysteine lyase